MNYVYPTDFSVLCRVWSSDLYTLLMRYEVNLTPYRIKSVDKLLDQTVYWNVLPEKGKKP